MDLTPEYKKFKSAVARKKKAIDQKQQELAELSAPLRKVIAKKEADLAEFMKNCPHEELDLKEYYFEGSYNDRAYTERWHVCKLCGAKGPVTTKQHSWYG